MSSAKEIGDRRLYKFVDDLMRICMREIGALDVEEQRAREVATRITNCVLLDHARFYIYVPAAVELQLDPRNQVIWEQYGVAGPDGARPYSPARIAQLAAEHKLTDRQVYSILSAMRDREIASRQATLPGLEDQA